MSHPGQHKCSHPSGIPQGLGIPCQMLSVTQEIPEVLRMGVKVQIAEPKAIAVSHPQGLQESQIWNQGSEPVSPAWIRARLVQSVSVPGC